MTMQPNVSNQWRHPQFTTQCFSSRVGAQLLSYVWLFATPWTVACQAPLSKDFSSQLYQRGLPFPPPGGLPNPGIEPIGRQILYHFATWEDHFSSQCGIILVKMKIPLGMCFSSWASLITSGKACMWESASGFSICVLLLFVCSLPMSKVVFKILDVFYHL